MESTKPIVGITMGDAAGIGPEIVAKIFADPRLWAHARPLVIGDARVMADALPLAPAELRLHTIETIEEARFEAGLVEVLDIQVLHGHPIQKGQADARCGEASVTFVKRACQLALEGQIQATTSAPVNKEAMHLAGYDYGGQTEIFAEMCQVKHYTMMLESGNRRLLFVTNHLPLKEVSRNITKERVHSVIKLAYDALCRHGLTPPTIAVAGLNPHAGDGGLLGREEIDEIIPAIIRAQTEGMTTVIGPFPPDTVFLGLQNGKYDAVISMYHDHGCTAMKLLGFQHIVTVLVGLPIIRTSVGHGTAYDITGEGIADPTNLLEAVLAAARLAETSSHRGVGRQ